MIHSQITIHRILGIALTSRGIGFALLEGEHLADFGTKEVKGDKNAGSLAWVEDFNTLYQPDVIALEDASAKNSRRAPRIQKLTECIVELSEQHQIRTVLLSQEKVRKTFFVDGEGTRHELAELLAQRCPEDLADQLPPRRKPWKSEDRRMGVFNAEALGLALHLRKGRK